MLAHQSSDVLGIGSIGTSYLVPIVSPSSVPVVKISPSPAFAPSPLPIPSPLSTTPKPTLNPISNPSARTNIVVSTMDLNTAVNEWRKARGLGALAVDDNVCKAVGERAKEIATDFSHDKFMDTVRRNNINYKAVSENIAMNSKMTAAGAVDQWDKSPHHHGMMLGDFNFGCGAIAGNYAAYIFLKI
jgi:uncharacterized protein YkwD